VAARRRAAGIWPAPPTGRHARPARPAAPPESPGASWPASPLSPAGRLDSWQARASAITLLGLIGVSLLMFGPEYRHLEAATAAGLFGFLTPTLAASSAPIVWFGLGQPGAFGLVITPDCSSGLLIAPLCLLGIGLMIPRRLRLSRVARGLSGAAALLLVGNMLRIGVIALAIRISGLGLGYQLGHLVIGSLVSIVGIVGSLVFLAWSITSPWRRPDRLRLAGAR
jgi:exosortase/archaeosortase family protein